MRCFAALVILFVYTVHSLTLPDGVVLRCPATYKISTSGGEKNQMINVNVTENKNACDSARKRLGKTTARSNETLDTFVRAVFKQEYPAYHAEITWSYTVTDEDLPMKFLLSLAFYKERDSPKKYKKLSSTCLQVSLEGHPKVQKNDKVMFHFDCLPLLKKKNVYLVTEVWSLPGMSGPRCRTKRSNPDTEPSCNGILCSKSVSFPISESSHRHRLCVCHVKNYGFPKLQWSINQQLQRINISLSNLPPYLQYVDVDIVEKDKDDKENDFETFSFSQNNIQKQKVVLEKVYQDPGRFTVYVCCAKLKIGMKCDQRNTEVSKTQIETECGYNDLYFLTYSETITVEDPGPDGVSSTSVPKPMSLGYILGIVGAIVVVGVVTLVTFLLCRCRNTPNSGTYLPATNGAKCGQIPPSIEEEPIELTVLYTPDSDVQNRQQSPNNEQETCVDDRIHALQKQVLLLYHTTSDIDLARVVRLKKFLERVNIFVKYTTGEQLQVFPEALQDIVLIFPQNPYGQFHYLKHDECSENDPFIEPENFDPVVNELFEKTAKMVQEGPDPPNKGCDEAQNKDWLEHNSVNLHLVSFDSEYRNVQNSVQAFLQDYHLTKSKGSVYPYYLIGDDLNLKENSDILLSLEARIKGSFPNCINKKIREINSSTLEL